MRILSLGVALLLLPAVSPAGPWIDPGDSGLRNDIQLLADAGVITAPVTQWPLSWGDILNISAEPGRELSVAEEAALARVQRRGREASTTGVWRPSAAASAGTKGLTLRNFEATPRESGELNLGLEWTGDRTALRLQGQYVNDPDNSFDNPDDNKEWRTDGSYAGVALGNWMIAAAMTDRWWGPGWQSSLILSNNARPIPAFTLDRNSTAPFESKWLSWIGNWDVSVIWGFLGDSNSIPNARFFGIRTTFKPASFVEIGLSRTAMWCGSGRPCSFNTFKDVLLGKDNAGDNVSAADEPGNQLGGYDLRLSAASFGIPVALYSQRIGEDEQNYKPSLFLTQFGAETWGQLGSLGTVRVYLEVADTLAGGNITGSGQPNVAYNHPIYTTGMRYRNRSIGHTADNDSRIWTLGTLLNDARDRSWALTLTAGDINRVGDPDAANTLTQVKQEYIGGELLNSRKLPLGTLRASVGLESIKTPSTGDTDNDWRLFVEWSHQW